MTAAAEAPPIGIDLGTTISVLATLDELGHPFTLLNEIGEALTPSALLFEEGELVIGREAIRGSVMLPQGFADCFKRNMGQEFYDRPVLGQRVPPEILSAFLLERLKNEATEQLGEVGPAVITVPAYFDQTRRMATQVAGQLAGWDVLDIINEPTAAAVYVCFQDGSLTRGDAQPRRVLVFDLGGGTFDVTLLEIKGRSLRTLATDGEVQLGGKDFDERLVDFLAEEFAAAHGIDPRSEPEDFAQLWIQAQEAKHALSQKRRTFVSMAFASVRHRVELTLDQFQEMTEDLLERTQTVTSMVLNQASLKWSEVDQVLLVGGGSRLPMVSQQLEELTGKKPQRVRSPDEAVAQGAALYAGMTTGRRWQGEPCELVNVNSHSLGVIGKHPRTGYKTNAILIPKNSPLPCQASRVFRTIKPNMKSVQVPVVEGESERPEACIPLGQCLVHDLPDGLPERSKITVTFRYQPNGTLDVYADIPEIHRSAKVKIQRTRSQPLETLDVWRERLLGTSPAKPKAISAAKSAASSVPQTKLKVETSSPPPEPTSSEPLVDRSVKPAPTANSQHLSKVLQQLDDRCVQLGRLCASLPLPAELAGSQAELEAAFAEQRQASLDFEQASKALQSMPPASVLPTVKANLAKARESRNRADERVRFALLVLGRSCAAADAVPPGGASLVLEIKRLQAELG
ncbi:Molecular chaperone DnaK [Planctomycetales bacterium 10988]|nr:Molecular chaperone DnaK [Planctomycetales bacterium 10988]